MMNRLLLSAGGGAGFAMLTARDLTMRGVGRYWTTRALHLLEILLGKALAIIKNVLLLITSRV